MFFVAFFFQDCRECDIGLRATNFLKERLNTIDETLAFIFVGQTLATTLQGDKDDVDMAVKSARKAYESWSKTPPHVRARYMYRLVMGPLCTKQS